MVPDSQIASRSFWASRSILAYFRAQLAHRGDLALMSPVLSIVGTLRIVYRIMQSRIGQISGLGAISQSHRLA